MASPWMLSPSQIKTWSPSADGGCNRKWAWKYLLHMPEPKQESTAKGTRTHTQFERYENGLAFDFSTPLMREAAEIAIPGLVHLPPPLPPPSAWPVPHEERAARDRQLGIEINFKFTYGGVVYRGTKDLEVSDSIVMPRPEGAVEWGGVPGFLDHKTTKSARYIKTPDVLQKDEQSVIYAYDAMVRFNATAVDVVYNYVFTEGARRSKRVHLRMQQYSVVAQMERIHRESEKIAATHRDKPHPLELEPNRDACGAFGGCPFRGLCTDLNSGPLGHITTKEKTMMTQVDFFAALANEKKSEDNKSMPEGITNAPDGWAPPPFLQGPTVAINPPEFQPAPTAEQRAAASVVESPETSPELPKAKQTKAKQTKAKQTKVERTDDAEAVMAAQSGDPYLVDTYVSEAKTIPAPPISPTSAPAVWTLYVDCAPVGESYTSAELLFRMAKGAICEEFKMPDYRFAEYGRGPGLLSIGVSKIVRDGDFGDIVLFTNTPEGSACLVDLVSLASRVVRGTR